MRLIPPLIFLNLTDPGTQYLGLYYQRGKHNTPELPTDHSMFNAVSSLYQENAFGEWMSDCVLEVPGLLPRTKMPSAYGCLV